MNPVPANPFVGLRPFDVSESLLFFGRGAQTGELLERLYTRRFVSVVGRSGCGKSSLIRAGLIPKLKAGFLVADRDRWVIATMKPGDRPVHNLAAAVLEATGVKPGSDAGFAARVEEVVEEVSAEGVKALTRRLAPVLDHGDSNFLLLADQFEEIFRFGARARGDDDDEVKEHDPATVRQRDEAADFVSLMLALTEQRDVPAYVVMTMRSDFLGDCDAFHGLPEAMNRSQYLVPRLSTQQREEAISGPIRLFGGAISPRLLDLVRNDVGDKLDQLPVMQHAMMRTWENWYDDAEDDSDGEDDKRRPVDVPDYRAAGTIKNALSDDAEAVLRALGGEDSAERKLTMLVFQALTDTDAENRRVRRPKRLRELEAVTGADGAKIMEIVERFEGGGRAFLTVARDHARGNHLIDISHESLIRQWKTLREWVDKEADWRSTYLRIADAAVRRKTRGGGLWDDPDLKQALDWWAEREPTRAWAEQYHAAKKKKTPGDDSPELDIYAEAKNFLEESRAARDREFQEKQRQLRREKNLTRLIVLAISSGLLLTSVFGAYAWRQRNEAKTQEGKAVEQAELAREQARQAQLSKSEALNLADRERIAKVNLEAEEQARLKALDDAEEARDDAEESARQAEAAKNEAVKQARIALTSEEKANDALADAREQTRRALEENERAEGLVYTSDINIVQESEEEGDTDRSRGILTDILKKSIAAGAPAGPDQGSPGATAKAVSTVAGPYDRRDFSWFYFWRLIHREARSLEPEQGGISSINFSADGKLLASSYYGGTIKLSEAATGGKVKSLAQQNTSVVSAALSPDGKTVVFSGDDNSVRLWNTESDDPPAKLADLTNPAEFVAYSPDGKLIFAATSNGELKLWEAATKTERALESSGSLNSIKAVSFTPDGEGLVIAGEAGVNAWALETGEKLDETFAKEVAVTALAIPNSNGGTVFVLGDKQGTVTIYGEREVKIGSFNAHQEPITSLALSPDGKMLATASGRNVVRLWDVQTQQKLVTLNNPSGPVTRVAFSPDGKTLAAGGEDGAVKLWDATLLKGYVEAEMPEPEAGIGSSSCSFSPDRRLLATLTESGRIIVWDAASYGRPLKQLVHQNGGLFTAVTFSPAGGKLAAGDKAGKLHLFDTASWADEQFPLTNGISALAYSPDGRMLAISGLKPLVLWDTVARREVAVVEDTMVRAPFAFSAAGDLLAATTENQTVALYDVAAKRLVGQTAPYGNVSAVAFAPDGRTLAVSDDRFIALWDVATLRKKPPASRQPEPLKKLEGHKEPVQTLAFSPDGRTLATGSLDQTVRLWSTSTHRLLATLRGHTAPVLSVAFAPGGRSLATADGEGKVKVWRAAADEDVESQCGCVPPRAGRP